MQASKVYILLLERNGLKPTQLLHQMHIPTDWYKQIMFTKKKEKKKRIKKKPKTTKTNKQKKVERHDSESRPTITMSRIIALFLTIFENLG